MNSENTFEGMSRKTKDPGRRFLPLRIEGEASLIDLHRIVCRNLPANHGGRPLFSFYREGSDTRLMIDTGIGKSPSSPPDPGARCTLAVRLHPVRRSGSVERVVPKNDQADWARTKLVESGFDIDWIAFCDFSREIFGKDRLSIASLVIVATGTVRDSLRARAAMDNGIGRMKAFGFGMLLTDLDRP